MPAQQAVVSVGLLNVDGGSSMGVLYGIKADLGPTKDGLR